MVVVVAESVELVVAAAEAAAAVVVVKRDQQDLVCTLRRKEHTPFDCMRSKRKRGTGLKRATVESLFTTQS